MESEKSKMTKNPEEEVDTKGCLLSILGICIVIFLFNFVYLYNLVSGPTQLSEVNFDEPGLVRYVEGDGVIVKIGSGKTKRLKLEIEGYYLMSQGDQKILIRHDSDFDGSSVTGRLEKLSKEEEEAFGVIPNLAPRKVNAYVSYLWGTNLFMLLAVPIFVVTLLLLIIRFISGPKHVSQRKINPEHRR